MELSCFFNDPVVVGNLISDSSALIFDPSPRIMEIKTKTNKWDLLKLKIFTLKERINRTERTLDWEKIFANDLTGKGLVSKIYKLLMMLNSVKTKTQSKNKQNTYLNRHFFKEDIQMDKRHMKRYSTSLVIREVEIKTTMKIPSPTTQNGYMIKKSTNHKCWRGCDEKRTLQRCW